MGKLRSFLRPAIDFAQRVSARNSVNFDPISKNKVPWYSGDRVLTGFKFFLEIGRITVLWEKASRDVNGKHKYEELIR